MLSIIAISYFMICSNFRLRSKHVGELEGIFLLYLIMVLSRFGPKIMIHFKMFQSN